jgi:N-formylglutamate amidohydrolase
MPGDLNIIRNLRLHFSGAVVRHLEKLRRNLGNIRAELARLRFMDKLTKEAYGFERYSEEIRTFEESIASVEREIDGLVRAIEQALQKHE